MTVTAEIIDVSSTPPPERRPPATSAPLPLPEFQLYRPRAGHPEWPRLAAEALELARELEPKLDGPHTGVREWRRRLGAHKTTIENYRINRKLNKAGRWDLRPLYFIWTTTRVCNFRCTYCDDHLGRKYPDMPNDGVLDTEQAKRLLKVMRTRTPSVYFSGGEPTGRKDLPELTRTAYELSYYPLIINTNGSLIHRQLAKPAWRRWLADMDIIVVSLDSLDLAELREVWVYKRPEVVVRNLLMLRHLAEKFQFKLLVNTVIEPGKVDQAKDVLDFVNDMGIWFCPVPMNVGPRIHPALPTDPAYRRLSDIILARKRAGYRITGSSRMNERLLRSAKLNCRNTLKPHIDFDGRVGWPCKSAVNVPAQFVDVLQFDHVDDLYEAASKRINPTCFHGPAANQCGGDCNWAQNYTTDAYHHGLENPLSLLGEVAGFLSQR